MSLLNLPVFTDLTQPNCLEWDIRSDVAEKWQPNIQAAEEGKENTISIYEPIGKDFFGDGMTGQRVAGMLRSMGEGDVTVSINSPGGSFFEGLAIYNILAAHKGKVTVRVVSLAASAASVIAMAADELVMAPASFLMIHNAWSLAAGNRHDMQTVVNELEQFDAAMTDIYTARTGVARTEVAAMLDGETWLGAKTALEAGFADRVEDFKTAEGEGDAKAALTKLDKVLASGERLPRGQRRTLLKDLFDSKPGAAEEAKPSAGDTTAALRSILSNLQK